MTDKQQFVDQGGIVRQYEYDDGTVLVADVGTERDGSVDVVEGTAIVVAGDQQFEFELPEGGLARATMNNGVVTIEIGE